VHSKFLTIIIPIYNAVDYITKAAESITAQHQANVEIVLVDDGSTDDSLETCLKLLNGINTVIIKQENQGLSGARNSGIMAASGEYILFLDADDYLLPGAIENICKALKAEKPDVLFGRYRRWNPQEGLHKHKPYDFNPPCDQKTEYILSALPEPSWNAWRYVCRREFLIENELFFKHGMLCEDVPWTLSLLEAADSLAFLQEPFYAYFHRRPNSILNTPNPQRIIDLNTHVKELLEKYPDRPALCRQLVWQSFLYINEYCRFDPGGRKQLLESYKTVLPLYKQSDNRLHRVIRFCRNAILLYVVSAGLTALKTMRRLWMR